jgi:hypothetical protein
MPKQPRGKRIGCCSSSTVKSSTTSMHRRLPLFSTVCARSAARHECHELSDPSPGDAVPLGTPRSAGHDVACGRRQRVVRVGRAYRVRPPQQHVRVAGRGCERRDRSPGETTENALGTPTLLDQSFVRQLAMVDGVVEAVPEVEGSAPAGPNEVVFNRDYAITAGAPGSTTSHSNTGLI